MKRKSICIVLLLVVSIFLSFTVNVQANVLNVKDIKSENVNMYNIEKGYIIKWMELNGYGKTELSKPTELYSIDGEINGICFYLNNSGYVVIDPNSLDIIEFSFDSKNPFENYNKVIYNGPMDYYYENNGKVINLTTKNIIEKKNQRFNHISIKLSKEDKIIKFENQELISELEKNKDNIVLSANAQVSSNSFIESGSLKGTLVTWQGSYYCQPDSASILLKYLYDTRNHLFLPTGYTTNGSVQGYLTNMNRPYIYNGSTNSVEVANGGREYYYLNNVVKYTLGMKQYLVDRGLSNSYSAYSSAYSFSTIRTLINSNLPVVVGTYPDVPGSTWSGNHAVVAHAYHVGYDGVPFITVNDTFGNNNVTINGSQRYYIHTNGQQFMWYIKNY